MARYSEVATSDEAVLVETDDFAIVFNKSSQKFYIKWWDAAASTWETRAQIDAADALQEVLPALTDDLELPFGADKDFTARYDATNDDFRIKDAVNAVDLFRLKKNTVVGYTVPVAPQDCINQSMSADSTGTKFTSSVKMRVDGRYLKKIRLRASWTASNTDSVTEVRVVGTTTGTIASVSGNTGTDEEAEGTSFTDNELVYIEVAVTTASATAGATTTLTYAIIEFIYEMV